MLRFDQESGLVFKEVTVSGEKHQCPGSTASQCRGRISNQHDSPGSGTNSLQKTAMRQILHNLERMDERSMSTLPHRIVHQIWLAIERAELKSLRVWKLFLHTELVEEALVHVWRTGCGRCSVLPRTIDAATTSPALCLTTLALQDHNITSMDLTYVSKLHNLRTLKIEGTASSPSAVLTDGIFRTWADEARAQTAFAHLEHVFLHAQSVISEWVLEHLNAFPCLHTFCLHECAPWTRLKDNAAGRRCGWIQPTESAFSRFAKMTNAYSIEGKRGEQMTVPKWSEVVDAYLAHKHSSLGPPRLNVYVGTDAHHALAFNRLACFERDWTFQVQASSSTTSGAKPATGNGVSKRRKLKDGKATALNNTFLGLVT